MPEMTDNEFKRLIRQIKAIAEILEELQQAYEKQTGRRLVV